MSDDDARTLEIQEEVCRWGVGGGGDVSVCGWEGGKNISHLLGYLASLKLGVWYPITMLGAKMQHVSRQVRDDCGHKRDDGWLTTCPFR